MEAGVSRLLMKNYTANADLMSINESIDNVKLESSVDPSIGWETDGRVPPHFFGELTKTMDGCLLLNEKGYFTFFADFLKENGLKSLSGAILKRFKAILWTVGHIGSTPLGLNLLFEQDLVTLISNISKNSCILSVRGTCCYVLGLISKTYAGTQALMNLGWQTLSKDKDVFDGIVVPLDLNSFLCVSLFNIRLKKQTMLDLGLLKR